MNSLSKSNADYLFPAGEIGPAQEFYRQNGFVAVSAVFGTDELHFAKNLWDQIAERRGQAGKEKYRSILLPHESFPEILKLIGHTSFLRAVQSMLDGAEIQLLQSQLMYGYPGTPGFSPHQDNFYNQVEPVEAVCAAWVALEDVDGQNGALQVWPGSHARGLLKVQKDWLYLFKKTPDVLKSLWRVFFPAMANSENDSGVIERFVYAQVGGDSGKVVVSVPAGAVVFMHGNMVHSSLPNQTADRFRYSLLTNFIKRGAAFNQGLLTGRKPLDMDQA